MYVALTGIQHAGKVLTGRIKYPTPANISKYELNYLRTYLVFDNLLPPRMVPRWGGPGLTLLYLLSISPCSPCREMKRGNVGLALGMAGRKIRSSLGASVDLGLTGKDGAVHPSLTVRLPEDAPVSGVFGGSEALLLSASRKAPRSWKRTSVYSDPPWRACCTGTGR